MLSAKQKESHVFHRASFPGVELNEQVRSLSVLPVYKLPKLAFFDCMMVK